MTDTLVNETTTDHPTGFRGKPRTRKVECDWFEPEDGAERLWAIVRSDVPLGWINDLVLSGVPYREMWEQIAPYVLSWNVEAIDTNTGEWEPVPPPAVAGPDAFKWIDPMVSDWLGFVLKTTYRSIVDPKASSPSSGTESSPSEPASVSSAPEKASRSGRKGSR